MNDFKNNENGYNNNDLDDSFFDDDNDNYNNTQDVNDNNIFNSNMFNSNQNENNNNNAFSNMFNDISNQSYNSNQGAQNNNFGNQRWQNNNTAQQQRQNHNFQTMNQQMPNMNQQMPNMNNNMHYNQQGNMYNRQPQGNDRIEVEYQMNSNNNQPNNDYQNNNYQNNHNDFRKAYTNEKQRDNFSGLSNMNLFDDDDEKEDELKRAALSYRNKSIMLKILTKGLILLILLGAAVLIYFAATYFLDTNKINNAKGINDILSEDEKYKTEYKEKLDKEDFAFLKDEKEKKVQDEDKPARKLQSRFMVEEEEMQNKSVASSKNESISTILGKEDFSAKASAKTSSQSSKKVNHKSTKTSRAKQVKHKQVNKKVVSSIPKSVTTKPKVAKKSVPKSVPKSAPSVQKAQAKSHSVSNANSGYWQVQVYSATDLKQTQQKWRDLRTEYNLFDNIEGHPVAASINGKVYYRLRVGPRKVDQFNPVKKVGYFANRDEAAKFCVNLKKNGIDCFVTLTKQEKL